jgi:Tol biopolymer transport system component
MPDNRHAVMSMSSAAAPKGGLWMLDTRSGAATLISTGLMGQNTPSVSPDGSKLAFTAGGQDFDLVEVPTDGSPIRDVLSTSSNEFSAAWVSAGSRFVYVTDKSGVEELRLHSQNDQGDRLIASAKAFAGNVAGISSPVGSPDGRRIAYYVLGAGGSVAIWISPVEGGAPVRLTREGAIEAGPEWSPDGQSMVFYHLDRGAFRLAVVRVGTSDPLHVLDTESILDGGLPAWSPNGDWIAYSTEAGVRLISPDGVRKRSLTAVSSAALVWSRDSKALYGSKRAKDGNTQIVSIDVTTGAVRIISSLKGDLDLNTPYGPGLRFTLAPDGKSFLATIRRDRTDVWILEHFTPRLHLLDWFRPASIVNDVIRQE